MLRGSPYATAAAVSIVHSGSFDPQAVVRALEDNLELYVQCARDSRDPVGVTLNIYTAQSLLAARAASPSSEKLPPPSLSSKCTWARLKQLRGDIQVAAADSHCRKCAQIAEFMEHCFERPAVFDRAWNGEMALNVKKVAHFMNTLVRLVCGLNDDSANGCKEHERLAAILSTFLVPTSKKEE